MKWNSEVHKIQIFDQSKFFGFNFEKFVYWAWKENIFIV